LSFVVIQPLLDHALESYTLLLSHRGQFDSDYLATYLRGNKALEHPVSGILESLQCFQKSFIIVQDVIACAVGQGVGEIVLRHQFDTLFLCRGDADHGCLELLPEMRQAFIDGNSLEGRLYFLAFPFVDGDTSIVRRALDALRSITP
jgi:hypothetical protein